MKIKRREKMTQRRMIKIANKRKVSREVLY